MIIIDEKYYINADNKNYILQEKGIDYLDNKYKIDNTSKLLRSQYAEIIRENK